VKHYSCAVFATVLLAAFAVAQSSLGIAQSGPTVVGIRGPFFTINGHLTYTKEAGFPNADPNLVGTLLNVRAVQALFDDANYPKQGSKQNPYKTAGLMGDVSWDYPDTRKWAPERNTREFIAELPGWRSTGLLAFTVNLQGGAPTDGHFGVGDEVLQSHDDSGFDPQGNLKPAYAGRLQRVIEEADKLGMVVIVGYFYQGTNQRILADPEDRYAKEAIRQASLFLKNLPNRNILIEIVNETNPQSYEHPIMQPDGILDAVLLAQKTVEHQIPVSFSWPGPIPQAAGRPIDSAILAADFILFHTNHQTPEDVHQNIFNAHRWAGYNRPLLINEDGVSPMNLHAAVQDRVGWGFYDQGWNNYLDGFQSPPTNWGISTPVKWMFFEQVARLTGSKIPAMPKYDSDETPLIKLVGFTPGQVMNAAAAAQLEVIVENRHPRWPRNRVEFYVDGMPFSYASSAPFQLVKSRTPGAANRFLAPFGPGKHMLRIVAYDRRGPRFAESCSILEVPFVVEK
jgi:hypothetical protein